MLGRAQHLPANVGQRDALDTHGGGHQNGQRLGLGEPQGNRTNRDHPRDRVLAMHDRNSFSIVPGWATRARYRRARSILCRGKVGISQQSTLTYPHFGTTSSEALQKAAKAAAAEHWSFWSNN